jgi:hypothetical protein
MEPCLLPGYRGCRSPSVRRGRNNPRLMAVHPSGMKRRCGLGAPERATISLTAAGCLCIRSPKSITMFTLFHLLELTGAFAGLYAGLIFGNEWFGWLGAVLGGIVGLVVGRILGRAPFAIARASIQSDLKRCDVATLRARLEDEYVISPLIIAELILRGEPVESFRDYVAGLRRSDSSDRREYGELNATIWSETVQQPPCSQSSAPIGSQPS